MKTRVLIKKMCFFLFFSFVFFVSFGQEIIDNHLLVDCKYSEVHCFKILDSIFKVNNDLEGVSFYDSYCEYQKIITLPKSFYDLKKIKTLRIEIPIALLDSNIIRLQNLQLVYINECDKNILPPEIKELKNLRSLTLYGIDTVIPEICELENLEYLLLYGNYNCLPDNIGNLKHLKYLRLMSPNLQDLPDSFGDLDSLEQLSFEFWKAEIIPKEICELEALEDLYFFFSKNIIKFPRCLSKLPNIEKIMLDNSYTIKQKEYIYRLFKNTEVDVELEFYKM